MISWFGGMLRSWIFLCRSSSSWIHEFMKSDIKKNLYFILLRKKILKSMSIFTFHPHLIPYIVSIIFLEISSHSCTLNYLLNYTTWHARRPDRLTVPAASSVMAPPRRCHLSFQLVQRKGPGRLPGPSQESFIHIHRWVSGLWLVMVVSLLPTSDPMDRGVRWFL